VQLFLFGLIKRERATEEVRARDRVSSHLDVRCDQRAAVTIRRGDAVQANAAGRREYCAGVYNGADRDA
jgi:hypothetical protein